MSRAKQNHFDDELLQHFLDGEASSSQAAAISEALEQDGELQARIEEMEAMRDALRCHLLQAADEVDFTGFADRVLEQCEQTQAASLGDRMTAWLSEVFSHRKQIWVPSIAAAAAAAALMLVFPRAIEVTPTQLPPPSMVKAKASVEVQSLETGTEMAMVYHLPTSNTTVIWIADR